MSYQVAPIRDARCHLAGGGGGAGVPVGAGGVAGPVGVGGVGVGGATDFAGAGAGVGEEVVGAVTAFPELSAVAAVDVVAERRAKNRPNKRA
jgi:hypothetical protein